MTPRVTQRCKSDIISSNLFKFCENEKLSMRCFYIEPTILDIMVRSSCKWTKKFVSPLCAERFKTQVRSTVNFLSTPLRLHFQIIIVRRLCTRLSGIKITNPVVWDTSEPLRY